VIQVKDHVTDIAGRAGVAFVMPETRQSEKEEIILDASDYHLLAHATWDNPSTPSPDIETAILQEYPVAQLGSTQQAISPPSAAELAAEKIDYYQQYLYYTPRINSVTPSQWLYRELHTGGKEQPIWATADDSAQAEYVNGTLTVCQRTAPCAASEQWLMPAGPSFTLIYPQYPRLTQAEIKQLRKLPAKQRMAKLAKVLQPARPLPTLPEYPQPLLAKLNTYTTGCTNVTGDCNVVNVAANVLTGYGTTPRWTRAGSSRSPTCPGRPAVHHRRGGEPGHRVHLPGPGRRHRHPGQRHPAQQGRRPVRGIHPERPADPSAEPDPGIRPRSTARQLITKRGGSLCTCVRKKSTGRGDQESRVRRTELDVPGDATAPGNDSASRSESAAICSKHLNMHLI
jgi:hypothetical protein